MERGPMRAGCLLEVAAAVTVTQAKVAAAVAASPIPFLRWAELARALEAVEALAARAVPVQAGVLLLYA
jgi:hypothetical protein